MPRDNADIHGAVGPLMRSRRLRAFAASLLLHAMVAALLWLIAGRPRDSRAPVPPPAPIAITLAEPPPPARAAAPAVPAAPLRISGPSIRSGPHVRREPAPAPPGRSPAAPPETPATPL